MLIIDAITSAVAAAPLISIAITFAIIALFADITGCHTPSFVLPFLLRLAFALIRRYHKHASLRLYRCCHSLILATY